MLDTIVLSLLFAGSIITLAVAIYLYFWMRKQYEGTEKIIGIAQAIREGAWAYLTQQYKVVIPVFIVLAILLGFMAYVLGIQNPWVPFAFLSGGFFSGLAGLLGMITATQASSRVASACEDSLDKGLRLAFRSGSVMGLVVVGLVLLDIALWLFILGFFESDLVIITTTMLTFGMGASTQALFARLGGGIYTKAADVGADLVGKVEEDIPEDDPRNPATIADNVGDNVGDVAGMGADLYESFAGAILATMALGAVAFHSADQLATQMTAVSIPIMLAVVGTILSIIGIFSVRTKENAKQKDLLHALSNGINLATILFVVASYFVMNHWLIIPSAMGLWGSVVIGLVTGWIIGKSTEYYTNNVFSPTRKITDSAKTGPATVIITGIGVGNISTAIPIICVALATVFAYLLPAGGMNMENMSIGLYGIGLAAVGMLSTLGITLATDAYGPIADNAGGLAEMGEMKEETRQRTDALDVLGNTTAATGKGFAIGSAALTALALLVSFIEELKIALDRGGEMIMSASGEMVNAMGATVVDILSHYEVHPFNPKMLFGIFIGVGMVFMFSGLTMLSVGKAAAEMVEEARRQFREIPGLREGTGTPDYQRCVRISTAAAQKRMVLPSFLAILVPIGTGLLFGVPAVIGLLIGALCCGFPYAVYMANTGGAWDNAKKLVEGDEYEGGEKGSEQHKALVVGDTVGDPFKDTSGPSINILVKLMSMVSIVMVGLIAFFSIPW
jgi:K(+)-stimulated pyrophosphate-energized sodium pump